MQQDSSSGNCGAAAPQADRNVCPTFTLRDWLITAGVVAITFLIYAPTLSANFVNYDDPIYVTENADVQEGFKLDTVLWAFQERRRSSHWHPLTWISLAVDFELFGYKPWGYHLVNVLLHACNAVLVFAVFRRATRQIWPSALVATLFACHPLNVEPVAWVSGRKDLLAGFFWLGSTLVYLHYATSQSPRLYVDSLLLFAMALLSKPMAVTMPATLLLWDAWLGRENWRQLLVEKIPYVALSAGSAAMTFWAMADGGTLRSLEQMNVAARLTNALAAHEHYLVQMVWPTDLLPFYPFHAGPPCAQDQEVPIQAGLCLGITGLVLWLGRREPALAFGWFWFLIVLAPVNGLVKTGSFAFADRYVYLPGLGVFAAIAFASARWGPPRITAAFWSIALAALAFISCRQVQVWHDSVSLWSHTVAVEPDHFLAVLNLGFAYESEGRDELAIEQFEKAIALRPDQARAHHKLGVIYLRLGRRADAIEHLRLAAERDERYREVYEAMLKETGE